jgi:hypothetical protein
VLLTHRAVEWAPSPHPSPTVGRGSVLGVRLGGETGVLPM